MRLTKVHVKNYRSIEDSNPVDIHPEMTSIVGMTGSGKTSFMRMLSAVDNTINFPKNELPNGSEIQQDYYDGRKNADNILQLVAIFEVEENDRPSMPEKYRNVNEIKYERYSSGVYVVTSKESQIDKVNLDEERLSIKSVIDTLKSNFQNGTPRNASLVQHQPNFDNSVATFLETNFSDISEFDLSIATLRNALNSIPADPTLKAEFDARMLEITDNLTIIQQKSSDDPIQQVYDLIPKPIYKDSVFTLQDEIPIDEFIANYKKSKTFHSIAVITGLTPRGLEKIRNSKSAEKDSYLDAKSQKLSDRLNDFWSQEDFDFKLKLDSGKLSFVVKDNTTGTETSVLDRSEGFKWWVAFFLEISTHLAKKSGRSIILLDNPATELHDEGKENVLKFIENATKTDKLQIIYSTHERALIDPWRTDRIRVVELTKNGTKIENVKDKTKYDRLDVIRRNIGSPARYSLFGAPRTLAFEGVSDIYIISAVNEYMAQQGIQCLHKDSYTINAINGIDKAPEFSKFHKEMGLDFVIVVDSGFETPKMKERLDDGDFDKHFIQINQITDKDSDTEDLIDSKLYYLAFVSAYKHILDLVPSQEEIDNNPARKRITNYKNWFKSIERNYDKTLVAQQMFRITMDESIQTSEQEALKNTVSNFSKLFELIKKKYD